MCSALVPRRHWKSLGAEQVHLSVCCSSSYSALSVIPSRWSPSTCPVEFLLDICGIFSSCDSLLQRPVFQFRYALPTCDVPPHNAAALTVVHLAPNDPTDLPSASATVVTSPPSCNLPQNVLQPAATRAGLPPIPLRLAAAASAVFSLQTQKSRAASQQQRQLGEPAAGGSGGRPVATAEEGRCCKRLSRFNPPSWTFLELLIRCPGTKLVIWIGCQELSFPPILLLGAANVFHHPEGAVTYSPGSR